MPGKLHIAQTVLYRWDVLHCRTVVERQAICEGWLTIGQFLNSRKGECQNSQLQVFLKGGYISSLILEG